jgi:hypothetical protein
LPQAIAAALLSTDAAPALAGGVQLPPVLDEAPIAVDAPPGSEKALALDRYRQNWIAVGFHEADQRWNNGNLIPVSSSYGCWGAYGGGEHTLSALQFAKKIDDRRGKTRVRAARFTLAGVGLAAIGGGAYAIHRYRAGEGDERLILAGLLLPAAGVPALVMSFAFTRSVDWYYDIDDAAHQAAAYNADLREYLALTPAETLAIEVAGPVTTYDRAK